MRAVVQRVKASRVEVDNKVIGEIGLGLNVLVGISKEDTKEDIEYIVRKIVGMRIFEDSFPWRCKWRVVAYFSIYPLWRLS